MWLARRGPEPPPVSLNEGRWCYGKTPMQTLIAALPLAKEKLMAA
jgi:hypothetical protein